MRIDHQDVESEKSEVQMCVKSNTRKILGLCGLIYIICLGITSIVTWFFAYLSTNSGYTILITINDYGEAHIELIIHLVGISLFGLYVYDTIKVWFHLVPNKKYIAQKVVGVMLCFLLVSSYFVINASASDTEPNKTPTSDPSPPIPIDEENIPRWKWCEEPNSGIINSTSTNYATAVSGGSLAVSLSPANFSAGQIFSSPTYTVTRTFWRFDTASWINTSLLSIASAQIKFKVNDTSHISQVWNLELYSIPDFNPLNSSDWNLSAIFVGSINVSGLVNNTIYSIPIDMSTINFTGFTSFQLRTSREGTTPVSDDYILIDGTSIGDPGEYSPSLEVSVGLGLNRSMSGSIETSSMIYNNALNGANKVVHNTLYVGQDDFYPGGVFYIDRMFLTFNTSSLENYTVFEAFIFAGFDRVPTVDFDIELYEVNYGSTVDITDWNASVIFQRNLVNTTGYSAGNWFAGALNVSYINQTGLTQYQLRTSHEGTPPSSSNDDVQFYKQLQSVGTPYEHWIVPCLYFNATLTPIADAGIDQSTTNHTTINFNGTNSNDPDGTITNWTWTFIYNGTPRTLYGATPSFHFDTMGVYNITLNVTDDKGAYDTDSMLAAVTTTRMIIRINNNTEFNATNGVNSGSGISSNPYIIDNWIIDGTNNGSCIYIGNTTKHFVIRNCSLNNASGFPTTQYFYDSSVMLYNTTNGTTHNNTFWGSRFGVYLDKSNYQNITTNKIAAQYGVGGRYSNYSIIYNNNFTGSTLGIDSYKPNNITISYNKIFAYGTWAMRIGLGTEAYIHHNNCTSGTIDVRTNNTTISENNCTHSGIIVGYCDNVTVYDNTIRYDFGLILVSVDNIRVLNNYIEGCSATFTNGNIQILSATNFTIRNNNISSFGTYNSVGIYIDGSAKNYTMIENSISNQLRGITTYGDDGVIYHNNFINNTLQAQDFGNNNIWDNSYPSGGNYWDDYSGDDSYRGINQDIPGSDHLGDTPYIISGSASTQDSYPLMNNSQANYTPIANAGFDKVGYGGFHRLYGNESIDIINGYITNWTWWFVFNGTSYTFYSEKVNFTFDVVGVWNVSLNVTDNDYNNATDYMIVNITSVPYFLDEGIFAPAWSTSSPSTNIHLDTTLGRKDVHLLNVSSPVGYTSAVIYNSTLNMSRSAYVVDWMQNTTLGTNDNINVTIDNNNKLTCVEIYQNKVNINGVDFASINTHQNEWSSWRIIIPDNGTTTYVSVNSVFVGVAATPYIGVADELLFSLHENGLDSTSNLYIDKIVYYNYTPPVANAGSDQSGYEGVYNFDASGSSGVISNYTWNFTFNSTHYILYGISVPFDFTRSGEFFLTLTVTNNITTDIDTTWVNITNQLPITDAGSNDTTYRGTYNFDGTNSYDIDGYITNYTWNFTYNSTMRYLYGSTPSYWFWTLGMYNVTLKVTDDEGECGWSNMTLTVLNTLPVSDAGPDQASVKAVILFNGSGSYDPDGTITNYTWTFTYNTSAQFMYGTFPNFYFYTNGSYLVILNVTDNNGGTNEDTMWVNITWLTPVADAGPNQSGKRLITFDGSGSSDGDGTIVNYTWNFTYNSGPEIIWGVGPSFDFNISGVYVVMLNVTDNDGLYGYDNVTITITITPPISNAGPYQTGLRGTYDFDGSASTDPDGTITNYTWTFTYNATGYTLYDVNPDFYFYTDGNYQITLNVTDDDWRYDEDTTWINITLSKPIPIITYSPFDDFKGVKLVNGGSSYDIDGHITNYTWTFTYNLTVYNYYTSSFSFGFWLPDNYTITLNLTDNDGMQDETSIILSIVLKDPIANAGDDIYEQSWTDMILNGSQSYDTDGYIVNWTWNFTYENTTHILYGEVVTFHLGTADGMVNITLTVTDDDGLTDTDTMIVTIINPITESLNLMVIILPLLVAILVMFLVYRLMRKTQEDLRKKGGY